MLVITPEINELFPIREYFLRQVYIRGGKYHKGHPHDDRLVLCPLHEDKNPSMGFIQGRDGVEKYHCFGCGSVGNVLELHMRINKIKDERKAFKDLCALFDIPDEVISKFDTMDESTDFISDRRTKILQHRLQNTPRGFQFSFSNLIERGTSKKLLNEFLIEHLWSSQDKI